MATVLVTGGAGYIGSHALLALARAGHRPVVLDNLSRGHARAVECAASAVPGADIPFIKGDINDRPLVERVLQEHRVDAVMHFAALAYVGESVEGPLRYYRSNVAGMISLLEAADAAGIGRFVFSSSCATYGQPPEHMVPIPETCPQAPLSPYGRTKLHGEHLLGDYAQACRRRGRPFAYAALRYFNVAGCDRSGVLGEDHDPETHLIPVVLQAALGQRPHVGIFGTDYPTPDGTCIRDYVHVEDLAAAHVRVMDALAPGAELAYNLGIGQGYSVREIIRAAERVTGRPIPVREEPRRAGDPPRLWADPARVKAELGWSAQITDLEAIVESAWAWFRAHPHGYRS